MFGFLKTTDVEGQREAVQWLRACVVAESGPAFMPDDRRKCLLILAYVERLERAGAPVTEGASHGS